MCYLPKATFYIYFAVFFAGYLWVFGMIFFRSFGGNPDSISSENEKFFYTPHATLRPIVNIHEFVASLFYDLKVKQKRSYADRCLATDTKPSFQICIHDPLLDKGVSAHLSIYKRWEPELSNSLHSLLAEHPKALFLDVGANIGYYSVLAASLGHQVLAIEPFDVNLDLLRESAQLNKMTDKIRVIHAAVSEKMANLTFVDKKDNIGGRFVVLGDSYLRYRGANFRFAPAIQLNSLVPFLSETPEIVMKMDIQAHECYAIRGAHELLQQKIVLAIFQEWTEQRNVEDAKCVSDMLEILKKNGFEPHTLEGGLLRQLSADDLNLPQDILWKQVVR